MKATIHDPTEHQKAILELARWIARTIVKRRIEAARQLAKQQNPSKPKRT
jgi:hypothetical protein